jgi:hypothetical protein
MRPHSAPSIAIAVLFFLHLSAVLTLGWVLNIWIDEAYTLHTTSAGLLQGIQRALRFELQPPLYFALLSVWRLASDSIFWSRLFSIGCAAATLWTFIPLSRHYLKGISPLWLVSAGAANFFLIWAATEIRLYSLAILISALLWWNLDRTFLRGSITRGGIALHGILAALALYTQYYLGFLLVGHFAGLAASRRWKEAGRYLVSMAFAAVLFLPMAGQVLSQVGGHAPSSVESMSVPQIVAACYNRAFDYVIPLFAIPPGYRLVPRLLLTAAAFALLFRARERVDGRSLLIWASLLVTGLFFFPLFSLTGAELLLPRHTAVLFVGSLLGLFRLTILASEKHRSRILGAFLALILLSNVSYLAVTYLPLAKTGDYSRAARLIEREEEPGQPIFLFNAEAALPFGHYYHGANDLHPIPREEDFEKYDLEEFQIEDRNQLEELWSGIGPHRRAWLVDNGWCGYLGTDYGCDVLGAFIADHYRAVETYSLYRMEITLLESRD